MPKTEKTDDGRSAPAMLTRRAQTIRSRGAAAAREGKPESSCPYRGWQGGYRVLWLEGFRDELRKSGR